MSDFRLSASKEQLLKENDVLTSIVESQDKEYSQLHSLYDDSTSQYLDLFKAYKRISSICAVSLLLNLFAIVFYVFS